MSGSIQSAPTASMLVSAGQAGVFPVGYGYYPQEGSRCVSAQYNWTSQLGFAEDLSQIVARGVETSIQAAYVDNSLNAQAVTITVMGTEQVITCPASSQGVFPLFFTGTPMLQLTVPALLSGAVTRVYYLNVPAAGGVWAAAGGSTNGTYQAAITELLTGGTSGLQMDAYGGLLVNHEASAPTYSCAFTNTPFATPQDVALMIGNVAKIVRVHQIAISASATAAFSSVGVSLILRTTGNSGASVTFPSKVQHDQSTAAAAASVHNYTAQAGGFGTAAGFLEQFYLSSSNTSVAPVVFSYGVQDQSVVLRNGIQSIAVNLEGVTPPAGFTLRIKFKWSEV